MSVITVFFWLISIRAARSDGAFLTAAVHRAKGSKFIFGSMSLTLIHRKHAWINADHGNAQMHFLLCLNSVIIEEEHRHTHTHTPGLLAMHQTPHSSRLLSQLPAPQGWGWKVKACQSLPVSKPLSPPPLLPLCSHYGNHMGTRIFEFSMLYCLFLNLKHKQFNQKVCSHLVLSVQSILM